MDVGSIAETEAACQPAPPYPNRSKAPITPPDDESLFPPRIHPLATLGSRGISSAPPHLQRGIRKNRVFLPPGIFLSAGQSEAIIDSVEASACCFRDSKWPATHLIFALAQDNSALRHNVRAAPAVAECAPDASAEVPRPIARGCREPWPRHGEGHGARCWTPLSGRSEGASARSITARVAG